MSYTGVSIEDTSESDRVLERVLRQLIDLVPPERQAVAWCLVESVLVIAADQCGAARERGLDVGMWLCADDRLEGMVAVYVMRAEILGEPLPDAIQAYRGDLLRRKALRDAEVGRTPQ